MKNIIVILLFMILPISSVGLLFIGDSNPQRKLILNGLLILNAIIYLFPMGYAYFLTPKGGNMWDENGPGAILWLYMIILPLCVIAQVVFLILKIVNRT